MIQDEMRCRVIKLLREDAALNLDEQPDLLSIGSHIIDILIEALDGNDRRQLVNAMSVLEQIGGQAAYKALPSLLALQSHVHPWVRMASAKAIGILGNDADVEPLLQWLGNESEILVQIWIIISLGQLGSSNAVIPLMKALGQTDSSTLRYTIIRALGELGDTRAAALIEAYLSDEDRHVRFDAVEALKKLQAVTHGEITDGR